MTERSTWRRRGISAALLVLLVLNLSGCSGGDQGPPRVTVEGQVTYQGRPVENGSILFVPTGGTHGPKAGSVIEGGKYRIPGDRGPVVGKLRVEIRAEAKLDYDITEPTESVKHIGEPIPRGEIPPEFNDQSTLIVETKVDGNNTFNFHLPD